MAFTVRDFHDLVEILEEHPAWRAEVRRLVLTDDFLGLPQALRDLAQSVREWTEAQRRYEEKSDVRFTKIEGDIVELKTDVAVLKTDVAVLKTDVAQLKTDVAELKIDVAELKTDVAQLKTDVAQLKTDVAGLKTDVARLDNRMGRLDGRTLQQQVRERLPTYLSRLALRLRPLSNANLAELLEVAAEDGRISEEQMEDAKLIDAVARGRRRSDGATIYLALEISVVVDGYDLERATRRAATIAEATTTFTLPVVIGETVRSDVRQAAEQRNIGVVVLPQE
ncbi:MAG: hypothetical protein KF832_18465 [Caldilineaceae bacterium]|nr:hypothetical protein [Caldilineaceae bacterium]